MTLLERIARELRRITKLNGGECRGDDENGWRDYIGDARKILEAIKTPSMAMNDAVFAAGDDMMIPDGDRPEAAMVWTTMIDAALSDDPLAQ